MKILELVVILAHAFVGWVLCGAIMVIGRSVTTLQTTLIIHAIGTFFIFVIVGLNYFKRFNYTTPLQTAIIFTSFVIFMDVFVVALLIEKSFEMFTSILGTWIPFLFIFKSTYLTGLYTLHRRA
jgi:hypothetical protein